MDDLAEQIVDYFPTEDKVFSKNKEIHQRSTFFNDFILQLTQKSWCNRGGHRTCGRLFFRFHNSRRNMAKQTKNTSTSTHPLNSSEDEDEEKNFVSCLNNTRKIQKATLHSIFTSVLDVGRNYTRIIKGIERQL